MIETGAVLQVNEYKWPGFKGLYLDGLTLDGALTKAKNVRLQPSGDLHRRKPTNPITMTAQTITSRAGRGTKSLFQFENSIGSRYFLADYEYGTSNLMQMDGFTLTTTAGAVTVLGQTTLKNALTCSDTIKPKYAIMQDRCFRVDGSNANLYIKDLTVTHTVGCTAPTVAPNPADTTGGSILPGTYIVFYTYIKRDGQGTEMVTNGTFDADTGWTKGSGWTINTGTKKAVKGAGAGVLEPSTPLTVVAGNRYLIVYTIASWSGTGWFDVTIGGTTEHANGIDGTYHRYVTATNTGNLTFTTSESASTCTLDGVSVKNVSSAYTVESEPSPGGSVAVTNTAIKFTPVRNTDTDVVSIKIYRTLLGAEDAYAYYDQEVSNDAVEATLINADTTLQGRTSDVGYEVINVTADYNGYMYHDVPPLAKYVLSAGSRMWYAVNSTLYWSNIDEPEHVYSLNYQTFDPLDGDIITGIAALNNNIIVFKRKKMWLVDMYSTSVVDGVAQISKQPVSRQYGAFAPNSIQVTGEQNSVIFLSEEGVLKWDGASGFTNISKNRINTVISEYMKYGSGELIDSMYYPERKEYHLLLYYRSTDTISAQRHFVYSLEADGWTEDVMVATNGTPVYETCLGYVSDDYHRLIPLGATLATTTGTSTVIYQYDFDVAANSEDVDSLVKNLGESDYIVSTCQDSSSNIYYCASDLYKAVWATNTYNTATAINEDVYFYYVACDSADNLYALTATDITPSTTFTMYNCSSSGVLSNGVELTNFDTSVSPGGSDVWCLENFAMVGYAPLEGSGVAYMFVKNATTGVWEIRTDIGGTLGLEYTFDSAYTIYPESIELHDDIIFFTLYSTLTNKYIFGQYNVTSGTETNLAYIPVGAHARITAVDTDEVYIGCFDQILHVTKDDVGYWAYEPYWGIMPDSAVANSAQARGQCYVFDIRYSSALSSLFGLWGVVNMTINNGGTGYAVGDILTIAGGGGTYGTVIVKSVDASGTVIAISLQSNGTSYTPANDLATTVVPSGGSDCTINILLGEGVSIVISGTGQAEGDAKFQFYSGQSKNYFGGLTTLEVGLNAPFAGRYGPGRNIFLTPISNRAVITNIFSRVLGEAARTYYYNGLFLFGYFKWWFYRNHYLANSFTIDGVEMEVVTAFNDFGTPQRTKRIRRAYLELNSQYATGGTFSLEPDYKMRGERHSNQEQDKPSGVVDASYFATAGNQTWDTDSIFDASVDSWDKSRFDLEMTGNAFRFSIKGGDLPGASESYMRIRPPTILYRTKGVR
jgi:hypothetical protein